jgi:hypothetical protein
LPFVGIYSGQYTVKPFHLDSVAKGVVPLTYNEGDDVLIGMSPSKISESPATYAYQAIVVPQRLSTSKSLFYTLKDTQFNSIKTSGIFPVNLNKGEAYIFY